MKRFKISILFLAALLFMVSCDKDFEEINIDPNNPVLVPSHLLIPSAVRAYQNEMNSTFTGADMGACWAQHYAKVQYNSEERYIPRLGILRRVWNTFYAVGISDAEAMYVLAEAEGNDNMKAVALVLQAYGYSVLTDIYGDIPFSEAIKGNDGNFTPKYDTQQEVYTGILAMLTQANSLFGSGTIDSTSDIMYQGDASKWKKFANSLSFRSLMRISGKVSVGADLQALVNAGNMFGSNDDEAKLVYLSADPSANPLYETVIFGSRAEYKINSQVVDRMLASNDPRLPQYAQFNDAGIYRGKPAGIINVPNDDYSYANVSPIGEFYLRPEAPGFFMSNAELHFLMAEAAHKNLITGSASAHYAAGIAASFAANEVSDNGYIAANALNTPIALEQIGTQKWYALYGQGIEAWTEWRRVGYPALLPALEGDINEIPSRYTYPTTEVSINGANYDAAVASQGTDNLTTKVWWNK